MRLRVLGAAVVVLAVLGGCRLEVDLNVTVERDGSGRVEVVAALDPEALRRAGGDLEAVLALDDLVEAGWEVTGPATEGDGFTRVRVSKGFDSPEASQSVLAEITGDDGPFQGFAVGRDRSFARTRWTFEGTVDLSGGLEDFGDEDLAAELDGEPIGRSVEELEEQLGATLDRLVGLRVSVRLPGAVSSNAATRADNGAVWTLAFGRGPADLAAEGTERRTAVLVWTGVGVLAALALVVLLLVRLAIRVTDRTLATEGSGARGRSEDPVAPVAAPAGGRAAHDDPEPAPGEPDEGAPLA
jgi:hypothetical protein